MIILITGTPGVGKTSIAKELSKKLNAEILNIKELARKYKAIEGYDEEARTLIVNEKKIKKKIEIKKGKNYIIDSHIANIIEKVDFCFVLRLNPKKLEKRLKRRAYHKKKIEENLLAEKLDACLIEALESHKRVYEIDTTGKSVKKIVKEILKIIKEKPKPSYGKVKWKLS